jgi:hypothetical protein
LSCTQTREAHRAWATRTNDATRVRARSSGSPQTRRVAESVGPVLQSAAATKATETLSQFLARILDQLSISAWLPSAALVFIGGLALSLRMSSSTQSAPRSPWTASRGTPPAAHGSAAHSHRPANPPGTRGSGFTRQRQRILDGGDDPLAPERIRQEVRPDRSGREGTAQGPKVGPSDAGAGSEQDLIWTTEGEVLEASHKLILIDSGIRTAP